MDLIEIGFIFLCGYALREIIGVNCLCAALTRIEQKLGTGRYNRPAPEESEKPSAASPEARRA